MNYRGKNPRTYCSDFYFVKLPLLFSSSLAERISIFMIKIVHVVVANMNVFCNNVHI